MAKKSKNQGNSQLTTAKAPASVSPEPSRYIQQRHPSLPQPSPTEIQAVLQQTRTELHWSGPLPQPAVMEAYRQLVPDAPERILRLAEDEAQHRRKMDVVREKRSGLSTWFAFIAIALALGIAGYALFLGHAAVAATIAGVTIGAIAITFAVGNTTEAIIHYFESQKKGNEKGD